MIPGEIAARGQQISQALPGWKVLHTGGGMFVAVKDFPLKEENGEAAVVIDGDAAAAYRRPDGWVRADEYASVLGHVEDAEEVILAWPQDKGLECHPAEGLFGQEVAREIKEALLSRVWD